MAEQLASAFSPEAVEGALRSGWIVPAGVIAIYFYGRTHFNSIAYSLDVGGGGANRIKLTSQTPANFTTDRQKYNLFSGLYILFLASVYLFIVYFYDILEECARQINYRLPDMPVSLIARAFLALCAVLGFLPSFPMLKNLDTILLKKLHEMALIPEDARAMAQRLYQAQYVPPPDVANAGRSKLKRRDTIRVAANQATGSLEKRVFEILCLNAQLTELEADHRYQAFSQKLQGDIQILYHRTELFRAECRSYFIEQERVVSPEIADIDEFFEQADHAALGQVVAKREQLIRECDYIYRLICLVVALSILSAEDSCQDINKAIKRLGFDCEYPVVPSVDWNAVVLTIASNFVLMLVFNGLFFMTTSVFGLKGVSGFTLDKSSALRFGLAYTIGYAAVMYMSIRLKRTWRYRDPTTQRLPEDILLALIGYVLTLPINLYIGYSIRHEWTYAPFLYAANQAVMGYFVGLYLDRSSTGKMSVSLPVFQGCCQAATALMATYYSPPINNINPSLFMGSFSAFQAAASGLLIGLLFQYFYGQSGNSLSPSSDSPSPASPVRISVGS